VITCKYWTQFAVRWETWLQTTVGCLQLRLLLLVLLVLDAGMCAGDTHSSIVMEGAIAEIVGAMTRHAHDRSVCYSGAAALGNLAALPHNRVRIASEGGVAALIAAMVNHRKLANVQSRAARALALIATDRASPHCLMLSQPAGLLRDAVVSGLVACSYQRDSHFAV
jgi:hypothetical protein